MRRLLPWAVPVLLAVALIVLRLCGVVQWSWAFVLAPIWIPLAIVFLVAFCVTIFIWKADS